MLNAQDAFKSAMRRLAATVNVITCESAGARYGITATAVTSLSADPQSLLVCVNRGSSICPIIEERRAFCVNILAAHHVEVSQAFGGGANGAGKFATGHWGITDEGLPFLDDAQASLICDFDYTVSYGTHNVFLAGRSRKKRGTLKQLHADLMAFGFTGSYGRVVAFARDWRTEQRTAGRGIFVPLSFRPGEAVQFDWSEDYAVICSERTKLQVAHIALSHSRAFLVWAYLLQTHEMLFDAHWHGFRVFGAYLVVASMIIYGYLPREMTFGGTWHWMRESIRPIAEAITLLALMGAHYPCPHNMIDLRALVGSCGLCRYAISSTSHSSLPHRQRLANDYCAA